MPVAPTSSQALARGYLAATVAASPTWQAWCGHPGNATAALAAIAFQERPDTTTPICIIESGEIDRRQIAGGASNWVDGTGTLYLYFRDAVLGGELPDQAHVVDALTTFENNVDGVIGDLWGFAGQAGYLDMSGVRPEEPPQRTEYQEAESQTAGAFWSQSWVVEFRVL